MLFLSTGDLPPLLKPLLLNAKRGVREREGSLITALLWLHNSIALARVKSPDHVRRKSEQVSTNWFLEAVLAALKDLF